ncbi:bifunctional metallophosphatase/5'-nucleotidase [Amycolatopsis acidiphila]|uniref:Bifunctional metallophosphatase/5'-nucleotidase n=1 Tax=Amycolatopsis acidiphila TaxID=715473 RepID=A0A557ZMM7_9PSEU|nr:bifunctional metallophosphatase/5'-nucleotidase [Amycolatopsis acidiphila]TVT13279.1 bifunctional metallophosphatase/5'-nucleotidase [Amycolatopsis acidiphila]UIJ60035.1 bifunctional metallophosphatase/5'-nucleotidase [Amycolatopsis acidiphila]GHG61733.1 bifunctional metallophosphatase/5'-nucleotidase [Amycolatopsis acidiphila]
MTLSPRLLRRTVAVTAAVLAGLVATAAPASAQRPDPTTDVRLITLNDFHGNLEPPAGSSGRVTLSDGTTVDAGGAAYLATHVKQLESQVRNSLLLSAGDNVGASPLTSALFHDEPTIDFLNEIGVQASVVGNHEFDEGYQELQRMQFGGCHPTDGCQYEKSYRGANFPFLGSNVYFDNGLPALLPFTVKISGGMPIGVIGATLEDLPTVVTPTAIEGLKFDDEVEAINRTSGWLDRLGIRSQVVLLHQGDNAPTGGPDDCNVTPGAATQIAKNVSASVDAIFTGHSHQQYNCVINDPAGNPRTVIQGASFGRLLSVVDLKIDTRTRDVVRSATTAHNEIVTRDVTPDPAVQKLVDKATTESAPTANKQVGTITADLRAAGAPSGESALGDVIADAQLEGTAANNPQLAITNPGGIRADLTYASSPNGEGDGVVTYGEAFTVQPFSNIMQTITLTGANLKNVLEQQWTATSTRILQISSSLHYTYSQSAPIGSRVSAITVAGVPVDPNGSYRVSVNNFLAAGGDGFTEFTKGTDLAGGPVDLDALVAYLGTHPGIAPPPADRITVVP